jgi:hypothetical protein
VTGRVVQIVVLMLGLCLLFAFALSSQANEFVSTYSTYDTGPNGTLALFNVLKRERLPVDRLVVPFDLRPRATKVVAFMPGEAIYDGEDFKRFAVFERHGGSLVYIGSPKDDVVKRARKAKLKLQVLDVRALTNLALSNHPQNALLAWNAFADRGLVIFDERLQGYGEERSMWSVLPQPVRLSLWVALFAVLLLLVDANVRFAPPIAHEPPPDRDSAAYVASMAALLHRAHARRAALARFASLAPANAELQAMAAVAHPNDALLVRAAHIFQDRRKERS